MIRAGEGGLLLLSAVCAGVAVFYGPTIVAALEDLSNLQRSGLAIVGFIVIMIVQGFATPPRWR